MVFAAAACLHCCAQSHKMKGLYTMESYTYAHLIVNLCLAMYSVRGPHTSETTSKWLHTLTRMDGTGPRARSRVRKCELCTED